MRLPRPRPPKDPRTRRALLALRLVLSVAGLAVLAVLVGRRADLGRLAGVLPWLALSFVVAQAGLGLFAARLRQVLSVLSLELPLGTAVRVHYQSMFYYFFVPAGVGYEIAKLGKLAAALPEARVAAVGAAVVADRLLGTAVLLLLTLATLPATGLADRLGGLGRTGALAALGMALLLALLWTRRDRVRGALGPFLHGPVRPGRLLPALVLSAGVQLTVALAVWLLAAAVGIPVGYAQVVFATSASIFFQAVPVTLLGAGAGEVAGVAMYLGMGLAREDALLLVTLVYLHRLFAALVGGAWEVAHGGARLAAGPPEPSDAPLNDPKAGPPAP